MRKSIDFPLVSVALRFDLSSEDRDATIREVKVVVGVLGAKPRVVSGLDEVVGKRIGDSAVARIVGAAVHKQCKPLENVPYEAASRRQMLEVFTRRAVNELA